MPVKFDKRGNFFDKSAELVILCPSVKMKTTFTKHTQTTAPVNGCMAIWQRSSRPLAVVGTKT